MKPPDDPASPRQRPAGRRGASAGCPMSVARHLFGVRPPGIPADVAAPLLAAAGALAARHGAPLDVLELAAAAAAADAAGTAGAAAGTAAGPAAGAPPPLAVPATWWRCTHPGLARVDADALLALLPEALSAAGAQPAAPSLVLLPAGPAEELAARLAARLGGVPLGRATTIELDGDRVCATRAAWGGRLVRTLHSGSARVVACWRPQAAAPAGTVPATLRMHTLAAALPPVPQVETLAGSDALPALEGARLVVAGGRGRQGEAGFAWLPSIAGRLGAALGGSLPAVDAGWVPVARQVGQSGKFVTPRTYFAVGISGTPQHLAGVSPDSRVVAVNSDAAAPIFALAEVGAVAEWERLLPLLDERLAARLAQRAVNRG